MKIFLVGLTWFIFCVTRCSTAGQPLCNSLEQSALLEFKESFVLDPSCSEPSRKLASWVIESGGGNCCSWDGVECSNETGHVISLDLGRSCLYGSIASNNGLFRLIHLQKLVLSGNNFNYSQIPTSIEQLSDLRYLDLSASSFSGQIPSAISRLSKLLFLDLSDKVDVFSDEPLLELKNPNLRNLVLNLTSLESLRLSTVNISSTVPDIFTNFSSLKFLFLEKCGLHGKFPEKIFQLRNLQHLVLPHNPSLHGNLPEFNLSSSLEWLRLEQTGFHGEIPSLIENLNSLTWLNLRGCNFSGIIPPTLGNLTKLLSLDLGLNSLSGRIPSSLEWLTQLEFLQLSCNDFSDTTLSWVGKQNKITYLGLSSISLSGTLLPSVGNLTKIDRLLLGDNQLSGDLPSWLGNLTQLTTLDLYGNKLQGSIPNSFSQLMNLEKLYLPYNNLSGTVELRMFLKLKNLTVLHLTANKLMVLDDQVTSPNATLPQFTGLGLGSCKLHEFPDFLRYQVQMKWLDLSENNIHHQIPRWLLEVSKNTLQGLLLRNNFLRGFEHPSLILPFHQLMVLDLDDNMLQGELPIPPRTIVLYKASNNSFTGEISPLICSLNSLISLDLSCNKLRGSLPPCLGSYKSSGLTQSPQESTNFPSAIGNSSDACKLRLINLSQNRLLGPLPKPLANCTTLQYFDMSNNQINDTFPFWLGALPNLKVVLLHSNQFHGQLMRFNRYKNWFAKLQIFDISDNQFHGNLCSDFFQGWSFMETIPRGLLNYLQVLENSIFEENLAFLLFNVYRWWRGGYDWSMTIINKGSLINYQRTQNHLFFIDLSSNKFEGNIPESIGNLKGVKSLNISNNNLSGRIPWTLKNMTELESLDLSQNQLSGEIPSELSDLNSLGTFKVSHNHLEGPIPSGGQFEAFPSYYFDGNPGLCGPPLSRKCKLSDESSNSQHRTIQEEGDSDSRFSVEWKEVVLGYGFGVVIGITFGMIFTRKRRGWFEATFGTMRNQRRGRKPSSRRRRR